MKKILSFKKILFIVLLQVLIVVSQAYSQFIPIDSIRKQDANGVPLLLNQTVWVRGVVTTSLEFGTPLVYFQDPTGGMVGYDGPFSAGVSRGDSVKVKGKVVQYSGLTEFTPVDSFTVLANNRPFSPITITCRQARDSGETYEGRLIKINNITMVKTTAGVPATQWTVSASGTNYRIFSGTDSCEIRIYGTTNIANTIIPPYPFSVTALLSQYKTSAPFFGGYQILPRDLNDIVSSAAGPIIANTPAESNIAQTSVTLTWTTLSNGDTKVKYFISDSLYQPVVYTDSVYNAAQTTAHTITLNNLKPGKIYYAQIVSANTSGTSVFGPKYFSTASHPASTGKTEVYFNYPVDTSYAYPGNKANGNVNYLTRLLQRVDSAQNSIDLAIYSFNDLTQLRDRMIMAIGRGVKIRIVYDSRNIQALMQDLINAGVQVIQRPTTSDLMHNKFFVFDGRDTSAHSRKWLWGGSANITNDQFYNDVQNVILIQDESLCNAYTREFEEMWGSHNDNYNLALAKFGSAKLDNTPHLFNINGKRVECYFSPSDDISGKIENMINTQTNKSINFCIYSFTRFNIANRMKAKYNPPTVMVRGVFDVSNNTAGSIYQEMKGIGGTSPWNPPAKVFLDNYFDALMHDKYILIDADDGQSNPIVETGSFNFSNAAQSGNDENILMIYDSLVANQYYQDFVKRLTDAGGTIDIRKNSNEVPNAFKLEQNFPNPFNPSTNLNFSIPKSGYVQVKIFDLLGREIGSLVNNNLTAGSYSVNWNAGIFSSSVYFYSFIVDGTVIDTKKMVLKK